MRIDGRWEGKSLDITGLITQSTLNIKEEKGEITGDFSIYFISPADDCCGKITKRLAHTGPISGKIDARTDQIELNYKMTIDFKPIAVTFKGRVEKADPHALLAMFGVYDVLEGAIPLTFEGGTCLLWLYYDVQKRREKHG